MPRPDPRRPGAGQEALFGAPVAQAPEHGRHSQAVDRAFDAAAAADLLRPEDEALAALVRAGAWALDAFEAENKPYGPAKLVPAITEALRELRMTPDARDSAATNEIQDLLNALGPTAADAAAPVSDAPHA